ncbi:MAG: hypothetical protein JOZ54_15780 [Acidobacteria bacterium]|nr:hypothetical protein [Acidobacteriota bacterium]
MTTSAFELLLISMASGTSCPCGSVTPYGACARVPGGAPRRTSIGSPGPPGTAE